MKSSWRSPDGGSSVAPNTKIEPSEAVFRAWWSTASTPIRSFHTVSEGAFCELRMCGVHGSSASVGVGRQTVVAVRRDAVVFLTRLLYWIDVDDGPVQVTQAVQ